MTPRRGRRVGRASTRPPRRAVVVVLAIALAVAVTGGVGAADSAPDGSSPVHDADLVDALRALGASTLWLDASTLGPAAAAVSASSPDYDTAREALIAAAARDAELVAAVSTHLEELDATLLERIERRRDLDTVTALTELRRGDLAVLEHGLAFAREELAQVVDARTQLAVEAFIGGRQRTVALALVPESGGAVSPARISVELSQAASEELDRLDHAWRAWVSDMEGDIAVVRDELDDLDARRAALEGEIAELDGAIAAEQAAVHELRGLRRELAERVPGLVVDAATTHRRAWIGTTAMTPVSLDAYVRAAEWAREWRPLCGLEWSTLAGIGYIESHHGVGSRGPVHDDGRTAARIFGIPLDGEMPDTLVVTDSDGGALDGDAEFDRAIGPMQFVPGTWRAFSLDGNGDGWEDPHNIYDATVTAAAYLCDDRVVTGDRNLRAALLTYNNSDDYVDAVTEAMEEYAAGGLPVGAAAAAALGTDTHDAF